MDGTNIILNGVGQKKQMIEVLTNYTQVKLFADNDAAGVELTKEIKKKHSNVSNMAERIYPEFKDFNAFLCEDSNNKELSKHHASK